MSVVRDFHLIVVEYNSVVSVVRYFILIVVKENGPASIVREMILVVRVKLHSESCQRFHLMVVKEDRVVSVVSEEKQRTERNPIFHFNSGEVKQHSVCS